ncbi:MAG: helicase, partial [Ktedonobacteraceae bacterium]
MDTINLPATIPGKLDLAELNRRLRQGDIALDWSGVCEASQDQLSTLLDGLDMVEQSEQLGLETVQESLAKAVLQVFTKQSRARREPRADQQAVPAPAVWLPEAPVAPEQVQEQPEVKQEPPAKTVPRQAQPILQAPSPSAIRDELQRLVLLDLLGPAGGPEEELEEGNVRDRYLVGMLAPRDRQMQPEELDKLAIPE